MHYNSRGEVGHRNGCDNTASVQLGGFQSQLESILRVLLP